MATADIQWELETLQSVQRRILAAETANAVAQAVPTALVEPESNTFAWIGRLEADGSRITVRASSGESPDSLSIRAAEQPTTVRATETGNTHVMAAEDSPEFAALRAQNDSIRGRTAVAVPLDSPRETGVIHLYTEQSPADSVAETVGSQLRQLVSACLDRHRLESELARERERLETLRSELSHDFGNPINLAAGRLDLVGMECNSEHLDHVERALRQIDQLSTDAVRFVRVGRELQERAPVDIETIAPECWEVRGEQTSSLSVEPVTVLGESERIRMLLNELFENAVVHNEQPVTVSVGPLPGRSGIYVEDDGVGIPADEREYVFDRGYTSDSDRSGHGLAIVAEIAAAHGWKIELVGPSRFELYTDRW